jgi:hypothetical protein
MLDSGAWRNAEFYVTVPATATIGEQDVAVVQVTGTGVTGASTLTTIVPYPVYLPIMVRNYQFGHTLIN